jgi:hypothetical protein
MSDAGDPGRLRQHLDAVATIGFHIAIAPGIVTALARDRDLRQSRLSQAYVAGCMLTFLSVVVAVFQLAGSAPAFTWPLIAAGGVGGIGVILGVLTWAVIMDG